jgi:hypothetical protein
VFEEYFLYINKARQLKGWILVCSYPGQSQKNPDLGLCYITAAFFVVPILKLFVIVTT